MTIFLVKLSCRYGTLRQPPRVPLLNQLDVLLTRFLAFSRILPERIKNDHLLFVFERWTCPAFVDGHESQCGSFCAVYLLS